MTLRELIQQRNLQGSPAEIAAVLNAKSEPVYTSELYTSTGVILTLGPDMARLALAAFQAAAASDPLLQSQYDKLNSTGLDFSHPLTQQMIDQLQAAGVFSSEIAAALKAIGVRYVSPYEQIAGEGQVVTAEQVEAALQEPVITGRRVLLSVVQDATRSIASAVVQTLAGDEIVASQSYSSVQQQPAGDERVDAMLEAVRAAVRDYLEG